MEHVAAKVEAIAFFKVLPLDPAVAIAYVSCILVWRHPRVLDQVSMDADLVILLELVLVHVLVVSLASLATIVFLGTMVPLMIGLIANDIVQAVIISFNS